MFLLCMKNEMQIRIKTVIIKSVIIKTRLDLIRWKWKFA